MNYLARTNLTVLGLDPGEETQVHGTWVATATLAADEQKNQKTGISIKEQGTVMVDPAVEAAIGWVE